MPLPVDLDNLYCKKWGINLIQELFKGYAIFLHLISPSNKSSHDEGKQVPVPLAHREYVCSGFCRT
jgi:hypothetical protein